MWYRWMSFFVCVCAHCSGRRPTISRQTSIRRGYICAIRVKSTFPKGKKKIKGNRQFMKFLYSNFVCARTNLFRALISLWFHYFIVDGFMPSAKWWACLIAFVSVEIDLYETTTKRKKKTCTACALNSSTTALVYHVSSVRVCCDFIISNFFLRCFYMPHTCPSSTFHMNIHLRSKCVHSADSSWKLRFIYR